MENHTEKWTVQHPQNCPKRRIFGFFHELFFFFCFFLDLCLKLAGKNNVKKSKTFFSHLRIKFCPTPKHLLNNFPPLPWPRPLGLFFESMCKRGTPHLIYIACILSTTLSPSHTHNARARTHTTHTTCMRACAHTHSNLPHSPLN